MTENNNTRSCSSIERSRQIFKGIVQGVGFRPFLYRSAQKFNLSGFVKNTSEGVILEVEGEGENIEAFTRYAMENLPPLSEVVDHQVSKIPALHSTIFEILSSENTNKSDLLVSPDIAVCENCKKELETPTDRRYGYAFINCTDCGPRMTIIQDLPYDRPKTTMSKFPMCPACNHEYHDPMDRRYHAQPVSCFKCGPTLSLYDQNMNRIETDNAVKETCKKLEEGFVVSIKGLGGYHIACLASSDEAVLKLRQYKHRVAKPFALMGTLDMIRENCEVSEEEEKHLLTSSAPILLLKRKPGENTPPGSSIKPITKSFGKVQETISRNGFLGGGTISKHAAPGQNTLGFMVPYTPLHILLLDEIQEPLVMTSANISDEPIIYQDDLEALRQFSDYILTHDRDIHLFADDSVARVFDNQLYMIRRSRGYIPFPITLPFHSSKTILGLGPMLKTTFTLIRGNKALTGPYIGDTESPSAIDAERFAVNHYLKLFSVKPDIVVIDRHPLYPNRLIARDFKESEIVEIQHHKAHVGSLLAEKSETGRIIGISMDGTGYGDDGNIWGGEFFVGDYRNLSRFGHLKYIFLPAGDKSVKEPWRFALSILYHLYNSADSPEVLRFARQFDKKGLQQLEVIKAARSGTGILTSSCGRVFDAVSSILGLGHTSDYDGHLPTLLQACAENADDSTLAYSFSIEKEENNTILNLVPLFHDIIKDKRSVQEKAAAFHRTLAKGIAGMAENARDVSGINKAGLTGGVFQNTLLLRMTIDELKEKGFDVLIHSDIPSNDGGISLGQVFLAAADPTAWGEVCSA